MSNSHKYEPYSAGDVMRYLEGRMNAREMRQMELAALDDPFLQDAIDGYRLELNKGNKEKMLLLLKQALAQKGVAAKPAARVVPFFRMGIFKYGVAALLVAGGGWLLFNLTQSPDPTLPQQDLTTTINTDTVPAGDVAMLPTDSTDTVPNDVALQYHTKQEVLAPVQQNSDHVMNDETERTLAKTSAPVVKSNKINPGRDEIEAQVVEKIPGVQVQPKNQVITGYVKGEETNNPAQAFTRQAKPAASAPPYDPRLTLSAEFRKNGVAAQHFAFSGKTVDKEKYPLENITLKVKGDTISAVSDELGRFNMNLPDSQVTLIASGKGIETKEFLVKSKKEKIEVELEPSKTNSLEEVIVSGYAARSAKSGDGAIVMRMDTADASPVGGWQKFMEYVEKNKEIKPGKKPVAVVLSFEINEKGRPASMDILDSGGKTYDKEAMRLLKEGPDWINKTTDKITFAMITIVL